MDADAKCVFKSICALSLHFCVGLRSVKMPKAKALAAALHESDDKEEEPLVRACPQSKRLAQQVASSNFENPIEVLSEDEPPSP